MADTSEAADLLADLAALTADLRERLRVDLAGGMDARPASPPAWRKVELDPAPAPQVARPRPAQAPPAAAPPQARAPQTTRSGPPPSMERSQDWRSETTGSWGRFDRPTGAAPPPAAPPPAAPPPAAPPPAAAAPGALFASTQRFNARPGPSTPAAAGHPDPWADVTGAWAWAEGWPSVPPGGRAEQNARALKAVREELGDCARCRLCEGRKNLVFGMGNPAASLVIVGEGPGATEDERGLPFVGASGEMLDRMLKNVLGLDRRQTYILNVVKCRPPQNRTPEPDEIASCRPFLTAQLKAIRPRIILALGRPATQTLLETTRSMGAMRGRWQLWGEVPVMPTFHPAYLLRTPADKALTFADLKMVRERMDELGL